MNGLTITENVEKALSGLNEDQMVKLTIKINFLKTKTKLPAQKAWDTLTEQQQLDMIAKIVSGV